MVAIKKISPIFFGDGGSYLPPSPKNLQQENVNFKILNFIVEADLGAASTIKINIFTTLP
jgi:hypothetical protein